MDRKRDSAEFEEDGDNDLHAAEFEEDGDNDLHAAKFEEDGDNDLHAASERMEKRRAKRHLTLRILDWRHKVRSNPREVKRRIRRGVTDSMRAIVWQFLSGGRDLFLANPGMYSGLLYNETSQNQEVEELILKDVPRTFPSYDLFKTENGAGQRSLYNMLKAYSVYDKEVGYTQGMSLIAGMLLFYMNEEEAFWAMVGLFKGRGKMGIRGQYFNSLALLRQYLFQFEMLVKEQLPELAKHFEEEMIMTEMYACSWFMTIFSADLSFPLVVRIWDVFLYEEMKIIFRVGLALLKFFQDDLLKLPFEDLLNFLRELPEEGLNADRLMLMACSYKLKKRLQELELEYQERNGKPAQQ